MFLNIKVISKAIWKIGIINKEKVLLMNLQWIAGSVILGTLDTVCHFVMTTAVKFGIILILRMGLRKSNNMNKIFHWSGTGTDLKSKPVGH